MRNISFMLTVPQMHAGTKDVTRRMGWWNLTAGQQIRACEKCMGLKKGEKINVICVIEIISTRREKLRRMIDFPIYGWDECRREGFPGMSPNEFVLMFCSSHKGCTLDTEVNRIEFKKVAP